MNVMKSAVAGLALLAASTVPVLAQDYTLKLHTPGRAGSMASEKIIMPWVHAVEENSGGRVKIEMYPSMSLGGRPPELVQQARDGVVDMVFTISSYTPGLFPMSEVFELPNITKGDPRTANLALYDMFHSTLKQEYKGLEVMFMTVNAGSALQTTKTAVRSPEDVKNMKISAPSRNGAWVVEALGGTPVSMPMIELPTALSKGVVDGALIPFELIPVMKFNENTQYQIEGYNGWRFGSTVMHLSMNKGRWESLPEDIKKAFTDASGPDFWAYTGDVWKVGETHGVEVAVQGGNEHIMLDKATTDAFIERLEPVVDEWVEAVKRKGIDGRALVDQARAAYAAHEEAAQGKTE